MQEKIRSWIERDRTEIVGFLSQLIPAEVVLDVIMVTPLGAKRQNILACVRRLVKTFSYAQMTVIGGDDGEYSSPKHPLFSLLQHRVSQKVKNPVLAAPEIALSDARYWRYQGISAYWYGLDGMIVGWPDEKVEIADLLDLIEVYTLTILDYLA